LKYLYQATLKSVTSCYKLLKPNCENGHVNKEQTFNSLYQLDISPGFCRLQLITETIARI